MEDTQARRPAAAGFRQSVADDRHIAGPQDRRPQGNPGYAPERAEDLRFLADLAAEGRFKPFIGKRFPLEQAVQAHRYYHAPSKQGNIIITLDPAETGAIRPPPGIMSKPLNFIAGLHRDKAQATHARPESGAQPGKDRVHMSLPNDLKPPPSRPRPAASSTCPRAAWCRRCSPRPPFVRDEDYALVNPDNIYSRDNSDIVRITENVLARLENAEEALLFPSGMAAIAALFRTLPNGAIDCGPVGHLLGHHQMAAGFLRPPPDRPARGRRRRSGRARSRLQLPILRVSCSSRRPRILG
jgi:hypothetical protein